MHNLKDKEYVYSSSLLLQMIPSVSLKDENDRISQCDSLNSLYSLMREEKIADAEVTGEVTGSDIDTALSLYLGKIVDALKASVPDPSVYNFLLYKFDCNNIKTAIKCRVRNIGDEGMYFPFGSVSSDDIRKASETRDFSSLPSNMAAAALEACNEYENTGEARVIDITLDKAAFADMEESVKASGIEFFGTYLNFIADRANFTAALRISESSLSEESKAALYRRAALECGSFDPEVLCPGDELGGAGDIMFRLPLGMVKSAITGISDPDEIDRALDRAQRDIAEKYSKKPFGPEVPAYCVIVTEERIRRFRKAASYISGGRLTKEKIREELS